MTANDLDPFTRAYAECALWSTEDDAGEPFDSSCDVDDIHPGTLHRMADDCARFMADAKIIACVGSDYEKAGHDFWLTRNGHGAGFWDGDWPEPESHCLTEKAHSFGEYNLYFGDDARIHGCQG